MIWNLIGGWLSSFAGLPVARPPVERPPVTGGAGHARYATGKYAKGICDVCGFACRYLDLRTQTREGRQTGLMVCPTCVDKDQPRRRPYATDAQALRKPRPENWDPSRRILHWKPTDGPFVALSLGDVLIENDAPPATTWEEMVGPWSEYTLPWETYG